MRTTINKTAIRKKVREKGMRISKDAIDVIIDNFSEYEDVEKVIELSIEVAKLAGRNTVKPEDIELVSKYIKH